MKADNLRISKVFSSGGDIHYVLPHFQREYTWEKDNWKTLWDDALAVYDEMDPVDQADNQFDDVDHFLGSIVVIQDGTRSGTIGAFKLVDGQQRLTTISVLLKALGKSIDAGHPHLARKIDRFLVNADEAGDLFFKILPTVKNNDRASYCAIIADLQLPDHQSSIPVAFEFFKTMLAAKLADGLVPERFLQVIVNAFQVVFVVLDQRESPYRIFESLNAKGKPLTQADLVRNYIAMKLPAARQEAVFTRTWGKVEELLKESRTLGRLPELTAFLHYHAMRTGVLCDEGHVYARYRDRAEKEFSDVTTFEGELETIGRFAVYFDTLLRPEEFNDSERAAAMTRLNSLEIASAYPFLLRLLDSFSSGQLPRNELKESLGVLENYMVRRYIADEPQNYLNRMFPALWADVLVESCCETLKKVLSDRNYPSNAKLLKALELRKMYQKNQSVRVRTALILDTLNKKLSVGTGGYTVLDSSPTIEHVMPQTLSDEWKQSLGLMGEQVHRDYLHTLGNLTLVTGEWNSELSNSPFHIKKQRLAENALRLNSMYFAGHIVSWGRDEIRERGETLGSLILDAWPSFLQSDAGFDADSPRPIPSEFHFEAVERIARHLERAFRRLSQSRYQSEDGKHRLVGVCSKPKTNGEAINYWFGIKASQRDFLEWSGESWLAFECGNPDKLVLFPYREFQPLFPGLHETIGSHWHVYIVARGDALQMHLPLSPSNIELERYQIGGQNMRGQPAVDGAVVAGS